MSISATSGNGQLSNFIPDMTSTQEVAVSYSAGTAEQAFGGVQMNLIPREGGNEFKGSFFATGANSKFQGSNYTPGTEGSGPADAQFPQGGLRRESRRRRPDREGQAVVLLRRPLADDANLCRRPVGEQERGRPDQVGLRARSRPPAVLPLIQKSVNTRADVAGQPAEQDRRLLRASISSVGAADAHHRTRVGHEVRLPRERILHRQLYVADHQQVAVRCEGLGHHPGLEGPLPRGRRQPGVHGATP